MKERPILISVLAVGLILVLVAGLTMAQGPEPQRDVTLQAALGTAFTYQGRLTDGGSPANGTYDFQFKLYDAASSGTQVGSTVTKEDVTVTDGLFTVELDFGSGVFTGDARYLEIGVRPGSSTGTYTTLSPRQALTATPYALYALGASWSGLTAVPAGLDDGDDDTLSGLSCSNGQVAKWNGNWVCGTDDVGGGSAAWSLTGNAGTTPGTHFLGTTDNQALELRVNNACTLRLEPNTTSPNLIGGYSGNSVTAGAVGATIGGGGESGLSNRVHDHYGTVGGGQDNQTGTDNGNLVDATHATVGGGIANTAGGYAATVGGGSSNRALDQGATVAGGDGNIASGYKATIGGGESNNASGNDATVGGGDSNNASGFLATIGGGYDNTASSDYATVGGGWGNEASGDYATIGGGRSNTASGSRATVAGGQENYSSGDYATIAGGNNNIASGLAASVAGGELNAASGNYSFAAGRRAKANHEGTFVWADGTDEDFASTGTNQFLIRASGGVGIGTNNPQATLHVAGLSQFDVGTGSLSISTPGGWPGIIAYSSNGHRRDIIVDDYGFRFLTGSSSSPPPAENGIRIFEDGTTRVQVLQITGGSDLAEPFEIAGAENIEPGMVVAIDPENPGQLLIADKAHDHTVAGCVSGANGVNPGLVMQQEGSVAEGAFPVALSGRVYCWADASYGPIQPGDLLTTSDTPGHAMKVTDYERAQGAILGKAMSSLEEGQGLVLVLATLQ
jgi:hypothetical protein